MVLECINTDRIRLSYQVGGKQEVVESKIKPRFGGAIKGIVAVGEVGEKLDYEVTLDTLKKTYLAVGTFTNVSSRDLGETKYYYHAYYSEEQRDSYEIIDFNGYWQIRAVLKPAVTGGDKNRFGSVIMTSQESYASLLAEEESFPRPTYTNTNPNPKVHTVIANSENQSFPTAASLGAPTIVEIGCPSYNIRVFSDTRELANQPIATFNNGRVCDPEAQYVNKYEIDAIQNLQQEFTKEFGKQGVEVLPVPGSPHKKELWLVDLDADGNETNRTSIFEFELLPEQGAPSHYIECLPYLATECPDNTCEVDCVEHICCYGSNGVAVHSFYKSES